jgi:hypothetical protein
MKTKLLLIIALLSMLTFAATEPVDVIKFTIINKSGMDIAVQLRTAPKECCTSKEIIQSRFYYLPVAEGDRESPETKTFFIERGFTYGMQLFYIETWDPVYGFKCSTPKPTALIARNNLRLTVLPCDQLPHFLGERTMWKFLPFPIRSFKRAWMTRLIY